MEVFRHILIATCFIVILCSIFLVLYKANKATPTPPGSRSPDDIRCEGCKGCKFTL